MPRNLHFSKSLRLLCCQASLNHTLGSSRLKISVKMGRHIGLRVTREGFTGAWKSGMNLEKRWWEEIHERSTKDGDENGIYYRNWLVICQICFLPGHTDYISEPPHSEAWPFT